MKIKKGDTVKIKTGKDRGKTAKVLHIVSGVRGDNAYVVAEGVNLRYKHMRQRSEREKGQRVQYPSPMHISNVSLVCSKCGKPTRVKYNVVAKDKQESGREKKQRICSKCKAVI